VLSPAHKEKVGRFLTAGELRLLVLAALTISGMIIISTQINAPPWLHSIALFGHLVSLLIGFGSVLTVDWYGLLFLFRVLPMRTVLLQAHRVTPLIWLGRLGLTVTGGLLEPDLDPRWSCSSCARCSGSPWSACSRSGPNARCCGWIRYCPGRCTRAAWC
jgi:hypothetical protein